MCFLSVCTKAENRAGGGLCDKHLPLKTIFRNVKDLIFSLVFWCLCPNLKTYFLDQCTADDRRCATDNDHIYVIYVTTFSSKEI